MWAFDQRLGERLHPVNAARLRTRNNLGFFAGTAVERAIAEELKA